MTQFSSNSICPFARRPGFAAGLARLSMSLRGVTSLLLLLVAGSAAAATGPEGLKRFFADVDTYSAKFEQVVLDDQLNVIEESGGTMWISRPGKFRWNYTPPVLQEIVSDGEKVWLYDLDLEQVTVRDLSSAVGRTPAILLAGKDDISNSYAISDLGAQGTLTWVGLKPSYEDSHFEDVRIGFEENQIRVMELVDGLGQTTRIVLRDAVENPAIESSLFDFKTPKGVDVINEGN